MRYTSSFTLSPLIILISFYANYIVDLYSICKGKEGFFFVKKGFLYKSSNHWSNKFSTAHHWKRSDAAATTCVFCGMSLTHLHGSHCEEFTNSDQPSMAMRGENSRAEACFYYTNWPFSRKSLNEVQQCLLTLISNGTKLPQCSSIVPHLHVAVFFNNFSTNAH